MIKLMLSALAVLVLAQSAQAIPTVIVRGEPVNDLVEVLTKNLKINGDPRTGIEVQATVCTTEQGGRNASCDFKINGVERTVKGRAAIKVYVAVFTVTGKESNARGIGRVSVGKYRCLLAGTRRFAGLYEPNTCYFSSKDAKPELKRAN
ncbi:MAG TPA: hypothetical protein VFV50_07965 [Bdellovibrionales bacterium]|nr:hypothetical protein [Bdellovibrionales bacterium]